MRGLFVKVFLCFWIAQSFTFVISTVLIVRHHFTRPNQFMDALRTTLTITAKEAARAYENAGCAGFRQYAATTGQRLYLADSQGQFPCETSYPKSYRNLLKETDDQAGLLSTQVGSNYLWSTKVSSPSGRHYIFLLSCKYQRPPASTWWMDLVHFASPQLPVAIVVYGVSTFVLVLLLTRPIARLRAAARDLANGKLATRIPTPGGDERIFGGDEIQELVHDFNHMAERLESLVDAQKMLLRDVSHELRSPLARLSVALELAREEAPDAMMEHLGRIEREGSRLNLLIGQLLRLSSMESTEAPVNAEEFSLNALLDSILPDAEFEAQQRACKVQAQIACQCAVSGNPELVYRAIENVLRNAIRYSPEGSAVEVDLACEQRGNQAIAVLKIGDRGPGIPESELENIFRPFYRVDNARQRDTGGFGVGLAIAERAVRLHRGEVSAQNRAGGGLVISIRIPCRNVRVADLATMASLGEVSTGKV